VAIEIVKAPRPDRHVIQGLSRSEGIAVAAGFIDAGFDVARVRSGIRPATYTVTATRPPCPPTS